MSDLKRLITREIQAVKQRLRGTIVSQPAQKNFDPSGGEFLTWVADVDVGGDQILRDVPIKIAGPKARFYSLEDAPVFLEKDAQGRYQIVAAADRAQQQGSLLLLNEDTDVATPSGDIGFTRVRRAFNFYEGTGIPGGSFWNDGVHGFPEVTVLDQDGNEV